MTKTYTTISFILIALLCSCFDDKSTLPTIEYPDLVVDRTGEGADFIISYGDEFTYEPKLGRLVNRDTILLTAEEYDDYNYLWKSTLTPNYTDTTSKVISHERILKSVMVFAPSSGTGTYNLSLEATHKPSGVTKRFNWKFKMLGTYGPGLLVADTRNETESDLSLVMSISYNSNLLDYSRDSVHRNLFSLVHKIPIEGQVSSMASASDNYSPTAIINIVIPGKTVIQLDPITMQENGRDLDLFYYPPKSYKPQGVYFAKAGSNCILMNDNTPHVYTASSGAKFSFIAGDYDYRFSGFCMPYSYSSCAALLFDLNKSKFVVLTRDGAIPYIEMSPDGKFDPTQMTGVEPIFGATSNNQLGRCLVKKDNTYYIYEFAYESRKYVGNKIYNMSGCTDLDKATCYAFSEGYSEFYYGVEGKLYVAILNQDAPQSRIAYEKFGTGEKLTHLLMHTIGKHGKTTWGEDGAGNPIWRTSANNLLSVATYNQSTKEGRIYTLPIQYGGDGGIAAEKYVKCYKKFGRITAVAARL